MAAAWKSPREIALIFDEEDNLKSVSVEKVIISADEFEIRRGMKGYPAKDEEGQPLLDSALVAGGDAVLVGVNAILAGEAVE